MDGPKIKNLEVKTNPEIELVFDNYPEFVQNKILALRELIVQSANEMDGISYLEETLKWGEPSYLTKHGSTIRIDWKAKSPNQYAIYFKCTSRLVETFKTVFQDIFVFEGKRAIIFQLEEEIPRAALKSCIKAALRYHKIKHLPTLGIEN